MGITQGLECGKTKQGASATRQASPSDHPKQTGAGGVFELITGVATFTASVAVWRILRLPEASAARGLALTLFFIQLALNAAWSWMFFGANNPLLGVINIVPQFLVILATVVAFHRLDRLAAWCLMPLAMWVGFASVLNIAIWRLNG